ncbi:MAG: hypothetical protein COY66_01870 [Candidatus Kerfeldbacteria bacterium CG_4_10_14_0_8_um_filter_42_10]|uniref:Cytochrome b/b6 N-terminal region profile domain-containing protein n=1 Tax=Candidatus Kerfeldbacteria bacterium CG_4_10_14_0_8_um_filter_42_10 TaxID=2014248 RepID=A0A2M7RJS2_9BACT|nr:MAG: hypothetical protein COY66_01870 [Candidatus Kerfeldbacteria bacterium CG_4_10_14_0_8_um_filter_42_10]
MTITGVLLKFPVIARDYFTFIDPVFIRYIHNQLSTYFGAVLFLMLLTGAWMYFYPLWQQSKTRRQNNNQ